MPRRQEQVANPAEPAEIQASEKHEATIIWLHMHGDSGNPWVKHMNSISKYMKEFKFVFPHAPTRKLKEGETTAWYDPRLPRDATGEGSLWAAAAWLNELIDKEMDSCSFGPGRIFLGGFDQGAHVALHAVTKRSKPLGGVVLMSTYIPKPSDKTLNEFKESVLKDTPTYIAHGHFDEVIYVDEAKKMSKWLRPLCTEEFFYRPGYATDHEPEELQMVEIGTWYKKAVVEKILGGKW